MVDVRKVPAELLLRNLSKKFQGDKRVEAAEWLKFAKAGIHKEKSWEQEDWFYKRLASTLRRVYLTGPIGTSRLSEYYGGRVDRGSKRYHPARGSRSIVRHTLVTLEKLGYVKKDKNGRSISPQGQSLLDQASKEVIKELAEKDKSLEKLL